MSTNSSPRDSKRRRIAPPPANAMPPPNARPARQHSKILDHEFERLLDVSPVPRSITRAYTILETSSTTTAPKQAPGAGTTRLDLPPAANLGRPFTGYTGFTGGGLLAEAARQYERDQQKKAELAANANDDGQAQPQDGELQFSPSASETEPGEPAEAEEPARDDETAKDVDGDVDMGVQESTDNTPEVDSEETPPEEQEAEPDVSTLGAVEGSSEKEESSPEPTAQDKDDLDADTPALDAPISTTEDGTPETGSSGGDSFTTAIDDQPHENGPEERKTRKRKRKASTANAASLTSENLAPEPLPEVEKEPPEPSPEVVAPARPRRGRRPAKPAPEDEAPESSSRVGAGSSSAVEIPADEQKPKATEQRKSKKRKRTVSMPADTETNEPAESSTNATTPDQFRISRTAKARSSTPSHLSSIVVRNPKNIPALRIPPKALATTGSEWDSDGRRHSRRKSALNKEWWVCTPSPAAAGSEKKRESAGTRTVRKAAVETPVNQRATRTAKGKGSSGKALGEGSSGKAVAAGSSAKGKGVTKKGSGRKAVNADEPEDGKSSGRQKVSDVKRGGGAGKTEEKKTPQTASRRTKKGRRDICAGVEKKAKAATVPVEEKDPYEFSD